MLVLYINSYGHDFMIIWDIFYVLIPNISNFQYSIVYQTCFKNQMKQITVLISFKYQIEKCLSFKFCILKVKK